jgi:hypothetical protein
MVEIPLQSDFEPQVSIHGEITPFRSPVDGTIIKSKAHLAEYMAKKGLRLKEPGSNSRVEDRYAKAHQDQAMRELIYENVDRMMQRTEVKRYLRNRR